MTVFLLSASERLRAFRLQCSSAFFPPGFLGLQKSWLRTSTAAMRGEFLHLLHLRAPVFSDNFGVAFTVWETAYAARVSLKTHHGKRSRSQGY